MDDYEAGFLFGERMSGINRSRAEVQNIMSEITAREQARQDKLDAEAKHAKAQQALIESYADLLPENEGQALAAEYAKQDAARTQAIAAKKQIEDTAAVYRDLPVQPARRAVTAALQNGPSGILNTLAAWSAQDSTTPNAADLRTVMAQHPYSGLDAILGKAAVSGFADQEAQLPVVEGRTALGTPYLRLKNTLMFDPTATADQRLKTATAMQDQRDQHRRDTAAEEPPEPPAGAPGKGMHWSWKGWHTGWIMEKDATDNGVAAIADQLRTARGGPAAAASGKPSAAAAVGAPQDADITYLRAHPELAPAFEKKFGAGTSSAYLK